MAVYIDNAYLPSGKTKMCRMVADTTKELLEMVDLIGVPRRRINKPGTAYEHFLISSSRRKCAVELGAIEVSPDAVIEMIGKRKAQV